MKACTIAIIITGCVCAGRGICRAADAPPARDRALVLLADRFFVWEFWWPYFALRSLGYQVDVAGPERRIISAGEKPGPDDYQANLSLSEVDPSRYVGLVLPGGYSPQNLEKYPRSIEICKAFADAGRPIGAICHGPRLLGQAGVLQGRIFTCLWKVADELPEQWSGGGFGTFVEQGLVVDGNLVTSRHPVDLRPFIRATLERFAATGGLPLPETRPRVIVVNPGADNHTKWAFTVALESQGIAIEEISTRDGKDLGDGIDPRNFDLLVVLDGTDLGKLKNEPSFAKLASGIKQQPGGGPRVIAVRDAAALFPAQEESVAVMKGDLGDVAREAAQVAHRSTKRTADERERQVPFTAAIALIPQFDDKVFAAMEAYLRLKGHTVALLGPKKGWIAGLAGVPAALEKTYDEDIDLVKGAIVVAPGGLWPESDADRKRTAWLAGRYKAGDRLVVFGLDSLKLAGSDPAFKNVAFASSDQAVWFFDKGGRYSDKPALLSAERLITAKGFATVPEAIALLEGQQ